MAVKKGYKQTEIGVIPKDWEVVALGRMIRSVEYGSSSKSFTRGAIPVIRMGNLQNGKIDWDDLVYTDNEQEIKRYLLRQGDVLFNRTNTIDLVGKSAIYEGEQQAIFAGYLIRINALPGELDTRYLNYILNTESSRKHSAKVLSIAVGQANINGQKLKTYPIPLPPTLREQEAIAEALSDADAWIESLEQLIAKKRQIKQGAMQELLTGKRRLPGFSGQWEIQTVRDLFSLVRNGVVYTPDPFGQSRITRIETISDGAIDFERTGTFNYNRRFADFRMIAGDMLFSHINSVEHIGKIAIYDGVRELFHGMNLLLLRVATSSNADFLYQLLNFATTRQRLRLLAKQAVSQASINTTELKAFELAVPCSDEQAAIAGVLSDMDTEIKALESKLAKAREIKQGMMQELLTGRIRLV